MKKSYHSIVVPIVAAITPRIACPRCCSCERSINLPPFFRGQPWITIIENRVYIFMFPRSKAPHPTRPADAQDYPQGRENRLPQTTIYANLFSGRANVLKIWERAGRTEPHTTSRHSR